MSEPGRTGWEPPSSPQNPASSPPAYTPPPAPVYPPASAYPPNPYQYQPGPYQPQPQPYQPQPAYQPQPPYQPQPAAYRGPGYATAPPGGYEVRGGYRPVPVGPGLPRPVTVQAVAGSPSFGVAIVGVSPITSGPASASLVAGVGSVLVSFVVFCWAAVGASAGWGPVVSGAFAVLAGLAGAAAVILGRVGMRQIRRAVDWGATKGRGLAMAGTICGIAGLVLTACAVILAFALRTPVDQ